MKLLSYIAVSVLVGAAAVYGADPAVTAPDDVFQIHYVSNLDAGDSLVNLINAGTQGGFDPTGAICVNVYAFSPTQAMLACCSCYLSPNSLHSLSARADLVSNTLTPTFSTSIVVKLLASLPVGGACNASTPNAGNLAPGMRAWGTTIHIINNAPVASETEFSKAVLSTTELTKLTLYCGFLQANGSGYGICKSCRTGGLGAQKME